MRSKILSATGLCASLSIALASSAYALERPFPANAKRGTLSMQAYPTITMNGQERRLSPGATIRNTNNTIDMPASLRGREYVVNYTDGPGGLIERVWILKPEEAAKPAPNESAGQRK